MENATFLGRFATELNQNNNDLNSMIIVLPNKRAKLFLLEELKKINSNTFFAPEIISVEELLEKITNKPQISSIELLLEFYEVYKNMTPLLEQQTFDQFCNWAKMLLQDFNEVDRYLLNPNHVFNYLKNIDDINHWSVKAEDRSRLIENYITFWDQIPNYYFELNAHLNKLGVGYQGMIYRNAVDLIDNYINDNQNVSFYFAGFNALNQAEEVIIKKLLQHNIAKIYWDIDDQFINDVDHGAGYFARKIKQKWSYYKTYPFEWIVNEFNKPKNIEIISTPKSIGQAKIVGKIIDHISKEGNGLQKTAIVLSEENLLMPVLYALPKSVNALNVTMSYDSQSSPIYLLFGKLFKMHVNAVKRGETKAVFYHKEVLEFLSHPIISEIASTQNLIKEINKRNLSFFSFDKLSHLISDNTILQKVLKNWLDTPDDIILRIEEIIFDIKTYLQSEKDDVSLTFLYAFNQLWNHLKSYQQKYQVINDVDQLFTIYKQLADVADVSFEGEPLEGLQIMGVLESRVLDFDNVIITSLNEGVFPAGKSNNSFIPMDVKLELGLPTFTEKDAIYTYHFYHLLLRAKNVFLLYNSDSEGLDSGEKSRFITQLQLNPQSNHSIKTNTYFAKQAENLNELMQVDKSTLLLNRLKEIASGKGFSPSAIANYMRNPMQFYMQRILGIKEVDEVEENIALNTLGTIIHGTLEELYKPFVKQTLKNIHIDEMLGKYKDVIAEQFAMVYSDSADKIGKNLLAFEVAKRNVYHFLMLEKQSLEAGDVVEILALEEPLETIIKDTKLPYEVKIAGIADRIEIRNGVLRIIDYKTGKVEQSQVRVSNLSGITSNIKYEKAIQLLMYGLMYQNKTSLPKQAGIYSFKNRKSGYLMFSLKDDNKIKEYITTDIIQDFTSDLINLLNEILDAKLPFVEKVN